MNSVDTNIDSRIAEIVPSYSGMQRGSSIGAHERGVVGAVFIPLLTAEMSRNSFSVDISRLRAAVSRSRIGHFDPETVAPCGVGILVNAGQVIRLRLVCA